MRALRYVVAISLAMALAACGGHGSGDGGSAPPDEKIIGEGVFQPKTKVMESGALSGAQIVETDEDGEFGILVVKKPQATVYEVGDIIIVDGLGGLLIKITGIEETDDEIRYTFTQASLAEAFESLDMHMDMPITAEDLGADFDTGDSEVQIRWLDIEQKSLGTDAVTPKAAADLNTLEISYNGLGVTSGSGIEIDGSSSFKLNPDLSMKMYKVNPNDKLPALDMRASIDPSFQTGVSITSSYGGAVSYTLDKDFTLPAIKRYIIVVVGPAPVPVPVWITPVITLSGKVEGTASSSFTSNYSYGVSGRFGFENKTETGAKVWGDVTPSQSFSVDLVDAELGVVLNAPQVDVAFKLYSVAGPEFGMGFEAGMVGKGTTRGTPPNVEEGVEVNGDISVKATAGLTAGLNVHFMKGDALFGDLGVAYKPFTLTVFEKQLASKDWFFPYKGQAAIKVFDNGPEPDDIFEIELDGIILGRTNKGGSGQFRVKDLRPGEHVLKLTTVEDDYPPGTWQIDLADGVTFSDGTTRKSGSTYLNDSVTFTLIVPKDKS